MLYGCFRTKQLEKFVDKVYNLQFRTAERYSWHLNVKNSLKPDYPPSMEVALTSIFTTYYEFFNHTCHFVQNPARILSRPKDADFKDN